jgi:hypothetical protein
VSGFGSRFARPEDCERFAAHELAYFRREAIYITAIPVDDGLKLPAGMNFGSVSGVAIDTRGHIFILHRGPSPLMEFDAEGNFVRALGDGLFDRPHGLRIDSEDNIWTTDVAGHVVYKFSPAGRIEMVLGVRGRPGAWHDYGHLRLFNEPNDVGFAANGDLFVLQGHGKGPSQVLKFDRAGNFIAAFGREGTAPGEFDLPHSIVIDPAGLLHIADRNNARIQVLDADGKRARVEASRHALRALPRSRRNALSRARPHRPGEAARPCRPRAGRMRRAGQDAGPVWRGALHRGRCARRGLCYRHAELARAEICEEDRSLFQRRPYPRRREFRLKGWPVSPSRLPALGSKRKPGKPKEARHDLRPPSG